MLNYDICMLHNNKVLLLRNNFGMLCHLNYRPLVTEI